MENSLKLLEKSIIISCQASKNDPIYEADCLIPIIQSVIKGGAEGLRLAGTKDIKATRQFCDLPIIGITKPESLPVNWKEIVYITPTFDDARQISEAGADIIAIDGTSRPHPKETLAELIHKIRHNLNKPVMADISTLEEGINCCQLGVDIVSTTLSGYTSNTLDKDNGDPDYKLLKNLVDNLACPVILEGRIWTPEQVKTAFELGAHAVVIGSAVTRPQVITQRFIELSR